MKEFYLVPKQIYDAMQSSTSKSSNKVKNIPRISNRWGTTLLPPPLQNKINLNQIKIPEVNKSYNKHHKSFLYDQLNVKFKPENLPHAKLILNFFDKSPDTQWDDFGDLFSPINGYNIIDIIHDFIFKIDINDMNKINDYRFLISSTNLPLHYIRNNPLRNTLSKSNQFQNLNIKHGKQPVKKVGGGKYKLHSKLQNWRIY